MAVSCYGTDQVRILESLGDGSFSNRQTLAVGDIPREISVSDLNTDGFLDLALVCEGGRFDILEGRGDGTFEDSVYTTSPNGRLFSLGRLPDGSDNRAHLAIGSDTGNAIYCYAVNSDFTCELLQTITGNGYPYGTISSFDWTSDGLDDFVVADHGSSVMRMFTGTGEEQWSLTGSYSAGSSPVDTATGDLNNDGIPDIMTSSLSSSRIYVFLAQKREQLALTDPASGLRSGQGRGVMKVNGDIDYWSFQANTGDSIQVATDVVPREYNRRVYVYLYKPDGSYLKTGATDYYGVLLWPSVTAPTSGQYTVRIAQYHLFETPYRLRVSTVSPPIVFESERNNSTGYADVLAFEETYGVMQTKVAGMIAVDDTLGDYYNLGNLASGTVFMASVTLPKLSDLDPQIRLLNSSGTELALTNGLSLTYELASDMLLYAHITTTNAASRGLLSEYLFDVALADTAPPEITLTTLPSPGSTNSTMLTAFDFEFSEEMSAPTVTDPANYELRGTGADALFGTSDDEVYALALSYFSGVTAQATILDGPLQIGETRFTVSTNLMDRFSTPLIAYTQQFTIIGIDGWVNESRTNVTQATSTILPATGFGDVRRAQGRGIFETSSDKDWWSIDVNAGEQLVVLMERDPVGASGYTPYCEVYTPDGTKIYGAVGGSSTGYGQYGPVVVSESGTYSVHLWTGAAQTYRVAVVCLPGSWFVESEYNNTTGSADIPPLALSSGEMNATVWGVHIGNDGSDIYRLGNVGTLGSNTVVTARCEMQPGSLSNAVLRLVNSSGVQLAPASGSETNTAYITQSSGYIYVDVIASGAKGMQAAYRLDLSVSDTTAPEVTGITLPANGTATDDLLTSFTLSFSETMDAASVTAATSYMLREAGDDGVFGNTDDTLLTCTPASYTPATPLTISMSPAPLIPGSYRFEVRTVVKDLMLNRLNLPYIHDFTVTGVDGYPTEGANNDSAATATPVEWFELGDWGWQATSRGVLCPTSEHDWYELSVVSNQWVILTAQLSASGNALYFELLDNNQAVLGTWNTPNSGVRGSFSGVQVFYTGPLYVRVRPYYTVSQEYRWRAVCLDEPWQMETESNNDLAHADAVIFESTGFFDSAQLFGFASSTSDNDWYSLGTLTNGTTVLLSADCEPGGSVVPAVTVYNTLSEDVGEIGTPGDATAEVRITSDDTYYVKVWPVSGAGDSQFLDGVRLNTLVVPTGSLDLPNLIVESVGVPVEENLESGDGITVSYTAANSGTTNIISANWTDRVVLSRDTVYGNSDDLLLGLKPQSRTLEGGSNYTVSVTANLPYGASGDYYILASLDINNQVDEGVFDGDNTAASASFNVSLADYPDIEVLSINVSGVREAGKSLTAEWIIQNTGAAAASGFSTFLRIGHVLTGQKVVEQTFASGGLDVGQCVTQDVSFSTILKGAYDVVVTADSGQNVYEHDGVSHDAAEQNSSSLRINVLEDQTGPAIAFMKYDGVAVSNGFVITKSGELQLSASDPSNMSYAEFFAGGELISTVAGGGPLYNTDWAVDLLEDGAYVIGARAIDALGNITLRTNMVTLALGPPATSPVITAPAELAISGRSPVLVAGKITGWADKIVLYVNGASNTVADVEADRTFSGWIELAEGTNNVQASQCNRSGEGPLSAVRRLVLDSSVPATPQRLVASTRLSGEVNISWWQPTTPPFEGLHLYRSDSPFSTTGEATRVSAALLTSSSYIDLPPQDGVWYYRLAAVNYLNTWSDLSMQVQVTSDRMPPSATIRYSQDGAG